MNHCYEITFLAFKPWKQSEIIELRPPKYSREAAIRYPYSHVTTLYDSLHTFINLRVEPERWNIFTPEEVS